MGRVVADDMFARMKKSERRSGEDWNAGQSAGKMRELKRPPLDANSMNEVKYRSDGDAFIVVEMC